MSYSEWMSNLSDNVDPRNLAIPGTHDSCAYQLPRRTIFLSPATITQDDNITKQLERGIRFFDIRIDSNMECYHGPLYLNNSFRKVEKELTDFLMCYQRECIFVSIKNESGDDIDAFYENVLSICNNFFWLTDTEFPTTMASIRKKIVLMRRFRIPNGKKAFGINLYDGWKDNDTFLLQTENTDVGIQDCYNIMSLIKQIIYGMGILGFFVARYLVRTKTDFIKDLVEKSIADRNKWYINFLSHQFIRGAFTFGIHNIADDVIDNIEEYLRGNNTDGKHFQGIFPMDFYSDKLVRYMINNDGVSV